MKKSRKCSKTNPENPLKWSFLKNKCKNKKVSKKCLKFSI
jgi:hypothetical protein